MKGKLINIQCDIVQDWAKGLKKKTEVFLQSTVNNVGENKRNFYDFLNDLK